jgi:hypothetical protein
VEGMIVIKVIAGIIGYIIISIIATILFVYLDRKAGEPAQKIYKEDSFYEYYMVGFLFPISLPCLVIGVIAEGICKFIKIMCVVIVETKIAIDEDKE